MIIVKVPTHYMNELNYQEIEEICKLSLSVDTVQFKVEEELRGLNSGQYIKILIDATVIYVCLSRYNSRDGRNSFILQSLPTAYLRYIDDEHVNKKFEYFVRDTRDHLNLYNIYACKLIHSIGIKILNVSDLSVSDDNAIYDFSTPFPDYKSLRSFRNKTSSRNSGNIPTTFELSINEETQENELVVYGKTYGANGMETKCILLALNELIDVSIKYIPVHETCNKHEATLDSSTRKLLKYINAIIDEIPISLDGEDEYKAQRDSRAFHYNLLMKYTDKKCYVCGCDIEPIITGAHIHRVTDIINSTLSEKEKYNMIVDGNNGLWLCSSHDLLFERGLIYFNESSLYFSHRLTDKQVEFVTELSNICNDKQIKVCLNEDDEFVSDGFGVRTSFNIDDEFYNDSMLEYINHHHQRVNK